MPRTNNGYWFKHFIDASVDEKIIAIAMDAGTTLERVSFCWFRILESAARLNDKGKFDLTPASIAWTLRCDVGEIETVFKGFEAKRMIAGMKAVNWTKRQAQPKTSNAKAAAESRARARKGAEGAQSVPEGTRPLTPAYNVSACNPVSPRRIPESESDSEQRFDSADSAREGVREPELKLDDDSPSTDGRSSERPMSPSTDGRSSERPDAKRAFERALEVDCRAMVEGLPVSVDTNFVPVLRLIDAGMTRDDILGGIRDAVTLRDLRARTWRAFEGFIREKAKDRLERAMGRPGGRPSLDGLSPSVVIDLKPRAGPRPSNLAVAMAQLSEIRAEEDRLAGDAQAALGAGP